MAALQAQGGRTSSDTEILQLQPDIANRIMHFMEFKEGRWYNKSVNTQKAKQKFKSVWESRKITVYLWFLWLTFYYLSLAIDSLNLGVVLWCRSQFYSWLSLPKVLNLLIKFEAFTKLDWCSFLDLYAMLYCASQKQKESAWNFLLLLVRRIYIRKQMIN